VADLLDGLARWLDAAGLAAYDTTGTVGDLFIETMPATPDEAIALTLYGGPEPDSKLGYDEPSLQVRGRGGADPRVSRRRVEAIRNELHGLGPVTLPDGTLLLSCISIQAVPASMGVDSTGRHEHVCNFRLEVRSLTKHRQ
jgi:hypothetical protein